MPVTRSCIRFQHQWVSRRASQLARSRRMAGRLADQRGFTLIEMALVLVIAGLVLGAVLGARSVIRNAQVQDSVRAVTDLTAAAVQFRDRFGMWPGDFTNAAALIPALGCPNGNGNGRIETLAESACASESLIRAAFIKGTPGAAVTVRGMGLSLRARTLAAVAGLPVNWVNVVELTNTDCDFAVRLDRALDDGNLNTGNVRTTANVCGASGDVQDEALQVAGIAMRLN